MCAKDDLVGRKGPLLISTQTWEVLFQTHDGRLAGELATAESVTAKDSNHVDTFGSDFAFSFAAWLQRIKCTLGDVDSLFADAMSAMQSGNTDYPVRVYHELYSGDWWWNIQQSLLDGATVEISTSSTLLAGFIPTTKIRDPLLKTLENAAKSGILLACADGRIRQCYLTICAILADYEEQVLLTGVKKNCYCTRCTRCLDKGHDDFVHLVDCFGWKHYNFNIHVSLATDTLHLLLKGLVMKMLDFMQDMLDDIYSGSRKTWDNSTTLLVAVVSPLFVSKAPFALHFIRAVCDLVILAQYKRALERMNVFKEEFRVYQRTLGEEKNFNYPKWYAEAHYITMVKQFYSMINKKEYILQICLHNSRRTALLAADYATVIHPSIKCWRSSGKRHNDPEHCDEEVLYLILIIIDYTCYDKDGKHMAYIGAFSEFYDLSTIIRLVHLVLRDLPDLITCTTMSYYVNNYIDWDEYNCLYLLTFDIDLLRTLREY
ncbi:hypothetical protein HBI69_000150 [Parastagonospora nodorum]|nr:hypothetical protein HBI69_000150 [Parastagonospora nodorum]